MSRRRSTHAPGFADGGGGQGQAKDGAGASARGEAQLAAMGAHQLAGDRQAEPAAARAGRAEKRPEEVFPRLGREAMAVIGNLDRDRRVIARRGKAQPVRSGLDGIAGEVEEHPVELVAVGLDGRRFQTLIGLGFLVIVLFSPDGVIGIWRRLLGRARAPGGRDGA